MHLRKENKVKINTSNKLISPNNFTKHVNENKKNKVEQAGGHCLPCMVDIRYEEQVVKAMEDGAKLFGGIDILINNASAISL